MFGRETYVMENNSFPEIQERINIAYTLFSRYEAKIYSMIKYNSDNQFLIDDIYQELFISIVKYPPPKNISSPISYLWKCITHIIYNIRRQQKSEESRINNYIKQISNNTHDITSTPLAILLKNDNHHKLIEFIQKHLSPSEGRVLLEKIKHNSNNNEIALKLGIKCESVSRYYSNALSTLRSISIQNRKALEEFI